MFELPKEQFDRAIRLFEHDRPNSTAIFSTLEGRTPGKVYVDNLDQPMNCLLTIPFLNFTFCGGALDQQWLSQAIAELRQTQDIMLNWPPHIAAKLRSLDPPDRVQGGLEFYDCRSFHPAPLPPGHQLRVIDYKLLARCLWQDTIRTACGTVENFLEHGLGLCLMAKDEICSEAYAVWRGANKYEIGIVTHEQHRQSGYAYLTCQHLIQMCEAKGYPTYWTCWQENVASAATARKLGYQTEKAYQWLVYSKKI